MAVEKSQSLYMRLVNDLRGYIVSQSLAPGDRLPSMSELCSQFGVSQITVRAALKVLADEGIIQGRQRLGYFVCEQRAEKNSLNGEQVIAVLVPYGDHSYEAAIIRGIMEECQSTGYRVVMATSYDEVEKEAALIEELSRQVGGMIILPAFEGGNYVAYAHLLERNVPWVFVDRGVSRLSAPIVATDNELGGYLATRHLIEQGYRRIYALNARSVSSTQERLQGYRRALKEANIPFDPAFVRHSSLYTDAVGYTLTKELLQEQPLGEPFGIFALNENIARTCYTAIKEAGLRIPEEIAIVGFDDFSAMFFDPPLTAVRQEPRQMGITAAQLLLGMMRDNNQKPQEIRIKPQLLVRSSSDKNSTFSLANYLMNKVENQAVELSQAADLPMASSSNLVATV